MQTFVPVTGVFHCPLNNYLTSSCEEPEVTDLIPALLISFLGLMIIIATDFIPFSLLFSNNRKATSGLERI